MQVTYAWASGTQPSGMKFGFRTVGRNHGVAIETAPGARVSGLGYDYRMGITPHSTSGAKAGLFTCC